MRVEAAREYPLVFKVGDTLSLRKLYLTIQSNNNYHVKTIISDIFTVLFDFYFDLGRGFRQESERTCM